MLPRALLFLDVHVVLSTGVAALCLCKIACPTLVGRYKSTDNLKIPLTNAIIKKGDFCATAGIIAPFTVKLQPGKYMELLAADQPLT